MVVFLLLRWVKVLVEGLSLLMRRWVLLWVFLLELSLVLWVVFCIRNLGLMLGVLVKKRVWVVLLLMV